MYSTARTGARPPQQLRRPRQAPLSMLKGATPTSAATCWREERTSSGTSASKVAAAIQCRCRVCSSGRRRGRAGGARPAGRSPVPGQGPGGPRSAGPVERPSSGGVRRTPGGSRCCRATRRSTNWRRSCTKVCAGAAPPSRAGPAPSAARRRRERVSAWASSRSVLARVPWARAKSRVWRGLTTTTCRSASAATTARSYPPVASSTMRVGCRAWTRAYKRRLGQAGSGGPAKSRQWDIPRRPTGPSPHQSGDSPPLGWPLGTLHRRWPHTPPCRYGRVLTAPATVRALDQRPGRDDPALPRSRWTQGWSVCPGPSAHTLDLPRPWEHTRVGVRVFRATAPCVTQRSPPAGMPRLPPDTGLHGTARRCRRGRPLATYAPPWRHAAAEPGTGEIGRPLTTAGTSTRR